MSDNYDSPIESLILEDDQSTTCSDVFLGDEVTEISAYREGDGSLWFAVKDGNKVNKRINGRFVVEVNHVR